MTYRTALLPAVVLLVLCSCAEQQKEEPGVQKVEYTVPTGEERFNDTVYGKEVWFAIGAVNGLNGVNANGVAQAHFFESQTYRLTMQFNVEQVSADQFYEVWVSAPDKPAISAGKLQSPFNDVRHSLQWEISRDLREYTVVQVTKESGQRDADQGEIVAQGTLTAHDR